MKEQPILFKPEMVRAILDGRKTQTRRLLKPQPTPCGGKIFGAIFDIDIYWPITAGCGVISSKPFPPEEYLKAHPQPYRSGDRLWVRESFWGCDLPGYGDQPCVVYDDEWSGSDYAPLKARPWARKFGRIPSIHMPRDCSRILLEITAVRVERLQDISEADAKAEGVIFGNITDQRTGEIDCDATEAFESLWKSINGQESWDSNPWVWVVEFKRVEGES